MNGQGETLNLSKYKGKIIVVINVASQCGFTNQYEDMQKIWEEYKDKGIVLIGVPSNDFGKEINIVVACSFPCQETTRRANAHKDHK